MIALGGAIFDTTGVLTDRPQLFLFERALAILDQLQTLFGVNRIARHMAREQNENDE